jgi:hypothetical protein
MRLLNASFVEAVNDASFRPMPPSGQVAEFFRRVAALTHDIQLSLTLNETKPAGVSLTVTIAPSRHSSAADHHVTLGHGDAAIMISASYLELEIFLVTLQGWSGTPESIPRSADHSLHSRRPHPQFPDRPWTAHPRAFKRLAAMTDFSIANFPSGRDTYSYGIQERTFSPDVMLKMLTSNDQ